MKLSIVIPIFNEQEVIPELCHRLVLLIRELTVQLQLNKKEIEIIFVNDGSSDNSLSLLRNFLRKQKNFKVLNLSRNFGHQFAVTAGIDYCKGDSVVIIDADLQDPPEFIIELYKKQQEGYDVVYAKRKQRKGESIYKLFSAKLFYRLMNKLTKVNIPLDTGDFRIMDRKVVDILKTMKERHRFIRGMVSWIGFNQTGIEYTRAERFAGETKYPTKKMLKFAFDAITSFSIVPLQITTYLGVSISSLGFIYSGYVVYLKIFTNETLSGWSSLIIAVLIMSGVQLITLGILGGYVGRINEEIKNRPLYIVENVYTK